MNKMKAFLGLIVAIALVAPASAEIISSDQNANFSIPGAYGSGARDIFAKWAPALRAISEFSTAAKLAAAGVIAIDGVCATTATDEVAYVTLYNVASVSGVTTTSSGKDWIMSKRATNLITTSESGKQPACEFFPTPIPASTGLVFINSTANMRSSIIYRVIRR